MAETTIEAAIKSGKQLNDLSAEILDRMCQFLAPDHHPRKQKPATEITKSMVVKEVKGGSELRALCLCQQTSPSHGLTIVSSPPTPTTSGFAKKLKMGKM
jgi:hypothetical protein